MCTFADTGSAALVSVSDSYVVVGEPPADGGKETHTVGFRVCRAVRLRKIA